MISRIFTVLSLVVLASCLDSSDYDIGPVTVGPEIAFPLAKGDIGLIDLLSDDDSTYLKVYPDGLLYFSYEQKLASSDIRNLFQLPDNSTTVSFSLPAGTLGTSSVDQSLGTVNKLIDMNLSPEQLSEILFKSGTLTYQVSFSPSNGVNPPTLPLEVKLNVSSLVDKNNQQPMAITTGLGLGSRSMQDQILTMDRNKFTLSVELILKKRSGSYFVGSNTKLDVQVSFTGMDFKYIKGFFGDQSVTLPPQSIDITVFSQSLKKSNITFLQPQLKLTVANEYGVPGEVNFTKLEGRKPGSVIPIQTSPSGPIALNYPTLLGTTATTQVSVSNATNVINFEPTSLYYAATARINKGVSSGLNFMADTSKMNVTMSAELPLYGKADNVVLIDTMKVDLSGISKASVEKATMTVKALNEMPLDARIQFYFSDAQYHVIDSLFGPGEQYLIKASTVASSGELATAGSAVSTINLDSAKINKLFNAQYLLVKAKMNTAKDASGALLNVKFKSSYHLKLDVGLLARLKLTTK